MLSDPLSSSQLSHLSGHAITLPPVAANSQPLAQTFSHDATPPVSQATTIKSQESWWSRLSKWWRVEPTTSVDEEVTDALARSPISRIPELEPPPVATLPLNTVFSIGRGESAPFQEAELLEGLAQMQPQTIEQIALTLTLAQLEIEKQQADIGTETLTRYQYMQATCLRTAKQITESLEKDKQVAGWLNTTQKLTAVAPILTSAIAALSWIEKPLSIVSQLLEVTASGSKSYYQARIEKNQALLTCFNHQNRTLRHSIEQAHDFIIDCKDSEYQAVETLNTLQRSAQKAKRNILKR